MGRLDPAVRKCAETPELGGLGMRGTSRDRFFSTSLSVSGGVSSFVLTVHDVVIAGCAEGRPTGRRRCSGVHGHQAVMGVAIEGSGGHSEVPVVERQGHCEDPPVFDSKDNVTSGRGHSLP